MSMDGLMLTSSLLSSRTSPPKYRGAPKQNARCWRGHKFGARTHSIRRPVTASTQLQPPPGPLRCRVLAHGDVAGREPRIRSELLYSEGVTECGRLVAVRPRNAGRPRQQRHDDARFIAEPRQSTAMLIKERFRRHHTCQVNWDWSAGEITRNNLRFAFIIQENLGARVRARWLA